MSPEVEQAVRQFRWYVRPWGQRGDQFEVVAEVEMDGMRHGAREIISWEEVELSNLRAGWGHLGVCLELVQARLVDHLGRWQRAQNGEKL